MGIRLIELVVPAARASALQEVMPDDPALLTRQSVDGDREVFRLALDAGAVEDFLGRVEEALPEEGYDGAILEVRACLPDPSGETDEPEEESRVNIDELVASVDGELTPNLSYLSWNVLAAVIACIGLVRDNVAIVIGAMIVAPLLAPSVGLAVATTLGDLRLARRAVGTSVLGMGAGLLTAAALGVALDFDPSVRQIALRTQLDLADFLLAGAAGVIAVLATVSERSLAQVGVMVAVALLPPLATAGLLLGVGAWREAGLAVLLLSVNIVGINLAGVLTLLVLRVTPRRRSASDEDVPRRSILVAVSSWTLLAASLIAGVHYLSSASG